MSAGTPPLAGEPAGRAPGMAVWLRRHGPRLALELGINFALPLAIYDRAAPHWGDAGALMASSGPPILWSLAEFVRRRRVDALSVLALAGIALSLLAFVGGGSARFLQLRENMVTAIIGLVFLGSAAIGRPLIFQLARAGLARRTPEELAAFEAKRDLPRFRRVMTLMTLVWGFGLLGSAALACLLVVTLSIHDYLIVSPFVGNGAARRRPAAAERGAGLTGLPSCCPIAATQWDDRRVASGYRPCRAARLDRPHLLRRAFPYGRARDGRGLAGRAGARGSGRRDR